MLITGICGQTGAGKSTLAQMLSKHGLGRNLEVDSIGHQLLEDDMIKAELVMCFGKDIIDENNKICRRSLGRRAFVDSQATAMLNSIMHPAMINEVKATINAEQESGAGAIIINAALLFSMELHRLCNCLVYVCTSPEIRMKRLIELRQWTEDSARERLFAQDEDPGLEEIIRVTNNGSEFQLADTALHLAERILKEERAGTR